MTREIGVRMAEILEIEKYFKPDTVLASSPALQ
jgi:hypothetical protein